MKKFLSICLMLSLVLTMAFAFSVQVLAAEEEKTVLVMKGKEIAKSREIEIDVTVEENTGVCGMLLSLEYDTSVFTLTNLEYGTAFASLSPLHTNTETDEGYGIYPFKITYLGEKNDTSTGTMMTLRFAVKDHAPDGDYTIILSHTRDQDVTYLQDNQILTKNLLIDGARISIAENRVTDIGSTLEGGEANEVPEGTIGLWLAVVIGGFVLLGGGFLLISVHIKRKQSQKWKKI